jgi:asparagine synthetase B (glutamine-hydrolysing)
MIDRVRLVLVNPGWREQRRGARTIFSTSRGLCARTTRIDSLEDGVSVAIDDESGLLELYRSIVSSDQLYHTVHRGELTVSDHFAVVCAAVPLALRRVPDSAIVDHFLFRTTPGCGTYLDTVIRLGNGELMRWPRTAARPESRIVGRMRRPRAPVDPMEAVDSLDQLLAAGVDSAQNACNLLSGGVDSSLLQSYMGPRAPSVSAAIDSPEFSDEASYARSAAALLDADHRFVHVGEAEYPNLLAGAITRTGLPPHHLQTVLVDAAVSSAAGTFVTGQFADALFGLDRSVRVWRIMRYRLEQAAPILRPLASLPWDRGRRFEAAVRADLKRIGQDPTSPDGFALSFAIYSDVDAACRLFGPDAVRRRLEHRLEYVVARVDAFDLGAPRAIQHLELGHWIDFFCDDTVAIWRQCAHSHGNALAAPFSERSIAELALGVVATTRFCRFGETKPLLKALLRSRVPAYPVGQPKGGSGLPLSRYLVNGPLQQSAAEASAADWPAALRQLPAPVHDWIVWNQLTLWLWDQHVRLGPEGADGVPFGLRREFGMTPA